MAKASTGNRTVVYLALAANLAIAVTKFIAAAITGSSAMISEGVHSMVDTINEVLLLYGMARSNKPRDAENPLGYGREIYFWSFIVALLVLALGAGVSLYEGIQHVLDPEPIVKPLINYIVLGVSFIAEGISWLASLRHFRSTQGKRSFIGALRESKDASTLAVLFEDTAALLGLLIAFLGVAAAQFLEEPRADGIASIAIACVLATSSILLANKTKQLLIGETASKGMRDSIVAIANQDPCIRTANGVITSQVGPEQVLALLSVEFEDRLLTTDIEQCVNRLEAAIRAAHPTLSLLFVKPQTPEVWRQRTIDLVEGTPAP